MQTEVSQADSHNIEIIMTIDLLIFDLQVAQDPGYLHAKIHLGVSP